MRFVRPSLVVAFACLCVAWIPLSAQQQTPPQQQQQPPATPPQQQQQQRPAQPPATPPNPTQPRNPFETVPNTPPPATTPPAGQPQQTQPGQQQPGQPPIQTVRPTPGSPAAQGQIITEINFRGARRTPADMLKTLIRTRVGDVYNEEALMRDYRILYNSGRFDDITLQSEDDPKGSGVIVTWVVVERRVIRSLDYQGIHTVTVSEILDRFKERKVGLTVESQYDPYKIQRASIVLKELVSERGRQYATVDPVIEQIPPSSL
jgi:outer membrane protein insertion porin family